MQSEGPHTYKFTFNGGWDNVYAFTTKYQVDYLVRFKPGLDYVPLAEPWRDEFYELVIEVISAPDPNHIPADRAIYSTIVATIAHFFVVHERVVLYICDDSDSRELARKRKFDTWYSQLADPLFVKYDLPSIADGPERYFVSIFLRCDNPNRFAIIAAFEQLASGEK